MAAEPFSAMGRPARCGPAPGDVWVVWQLLPSCFRRLFMIARWKRVSKVIQEAIDRGATTVEDIHKSVADLPLKVLEERPVLRRPAKEVRRVQDRSIGAVYDLIREVNAQVGNLASELLSKLARRHEARGARQG
jgi:phosphoribosylformylglycinamidine (FGAM) synthase-like enzyme